MILCHALAPSARRILAATLCLAAVCGMARAEATRQEDVLEASILPGWQTEGGTRMAALRLRLAPGWKTYWRSPGDAGIPPQFDWSGSDNLKSVRLIWPRPSVFDTNGMQTIGYHDELVLPVEITPRDPLRPVRLMAEVELGICRDICLPAGVVLSLDMVSPGAPDAAIRKALASQPKTADAAGLTAISCAVQPIADGLRVTATLTLPLQGGRETVAIETADPAIWVAEADSHRKGGDLIAVTEMVAPTGQPFALDRSGITVTVIAPGGAVEVRGCPGG